MTDKTFEEENSVRETIEAIDEGKLRSGGEEGEADEMSLVSDTLFLCV